MELKHYREEDYQAVCDFLIALNRETPDHIHWNWARFEWMMGHPEFDRSAMEAMGLWWDGGRVIGAALYDMYFGEAFCAALPGRESLFPAILDYAWEHLKDEGGLGIALYDGSAGEIAAATAAGFAPAEQEETVMSRPLEKPLAGKLPAGFRFVSPDPERDLEALQWLFWQGFDHGDDRAAFEQEGTSEYRERPHCRRELNVGVESPAGELAAFCGVWYCPETDYAYVEPVCTVPACRGKGLARAAVGEALTRAAALGAKRAYVISDQVFYEKLGFARDRHFTFYWKK